MVLIALNSMKKTFIIAILLISLIFNERSINAHGIQKIFWSESQQFDWEMFKEKRVGYGFIKALTHSSISYEVEVKYGLIVLNVEA